MGCSSGPKIAAETSRRNSGWQTPTIQEDAQNTSQKARKS
jgi:hypothetical protein